MKVNANDPLPGREVVWLRLDVVELHGGENGPQALQSELHHDQQEPDERAEGVEKSH